MRRSATLGRQASLSLSALGYQRVRQLQKYLRLRPADRWLLIEALGAVWAIRLAMWLLPFRVVQRALAQIARKCDGNGQPNLASREIAWAVPIASGYVPAARCLPQALAAQLLLARRRKSSQLRIGVAKTHSGQLEAHAWLESDGEVIFGRLPGFSRFIPFPPLEAARS